VRVGPVGRLPRIGPATNAVEGLLRDARFERCRWWVAGRQRLRRHGRVGPSCCGNAALKHFP